MVADLPFARSRVHAIPPHGVMRKTAESAQRPGLIFYHVRRRLHHGAPAPRGPILTTLDGPHNHITLPLYQFILRHFRLSLTHTDSHTSRRSVHLRPISRAFEGRPLRSIYQEPAWRTGAQAQMCSPMTTFPPAFRQADAPPTGFLTAINRYTQ